MRYNENMRYNVPSTVPDILYLCGYLKTWLIPSTSLQYSKKELQVLYPQSKAECEQHYKTNTNQIAYNSSEEETIFNESEVAQSCPTLCDPEDCSLPGSSVRGVLQAIILEWVAISFSRGCSQPRDQTRISHIAGRHFTLWASREDFNWGGQEILLIEE